MAIGQARITIEADASGFGASASKEVTKALESVASEAAKVFSGIESDAADVFDPFAKSASDAGSEVSRGLSDAMADVVSITDKAAMDAATAMADGLSGIVDSAQQTSARAADALDQIPDSAGSAGRAASDRMSDGMRGVSRAASSAADQSSSALGGISRAASGAAQGAVNAFSSVGSGVSRAFSSVAGAVSGTFNTIVSGATSAASSVRQHLSDAFDKAHQSALKIPSAVRGIGLALIGVAGPATVLKSGFDRLMNIQRAEIQFESIGMTAEQTEEQMAKLSDQVTGTSVSLSDAAKYSAMFAQSGVEMGDQMDDAIGAFANLSAAAEGTGIDVGRIMQQVAASGRIDAGVLNQLSDAGVNAAQYLADYTGKSVAEARKAASAGEISFDDLVGAINEGMGEYATAMGETLPAKLSNFKTAIANLGATIIEPFIPGITAAVEFGIEITKSAVAPLKSFIGWLQEGGTVAEIAKGAIVALGVGLAFAFTPGVVGLIMAAGTSLKAFGVAVWAATGPVGIVIGIIAALVAGLTLFFTKTETGKAIWSGFVDVLKGVWDWISGVFIAGWDALTAKLQDVWNAMEPIREIAGSMLAAMGGAVWDAVLSIWDSIVSVGQSLFDAFVQIGTAIWDLIQVLAPVLLPILKIVGAIIGGVIVGAFFALMGVLYVVTNYFKLVGNVISWLVSTVLSPLIGIIATVASFLIDKFGQALSWVGNLIKSVWEGIPGFFSALWGGIQEGWATFTGWLGSAWAGLVEIWETYGQPVVDWVTGAFEFLWEGVKLYFRLLGAAWEVALTGLGMAWEAWGQPAVDWVVSGFQKLWEGVQVVFGWVKSGWEMLWSGLQIVWSAVGQPVVDGIVWVFQTFWQGVQNIFGWIQSGWNAVWSFFSGIWYSYGQPIVDKVVAGFALLWERIKAIFAWIGNAITSLGNGMSSLWTDYVRPMIDRVVEGFGNLKDTIFEWKNNIIGWFKDAGTWLLNAGRDIIDGIITGVKQKAGDLKDAFLNAVPDWVKGPFREALGIASPSKVFAEYGRNIGEGMIEGINSMQGGVQSATTNLAGAAMSATPDSMPAVPTAVSVAPQVDLAAPIDSTPVMDFTTTVQEQFANVAAPAVTGFSNTLVNTKAGMVDPALAGMSMNVAANAAQFSEQINGVTNPAVLGMGQNMLNVKGGMVDPALFGMGFNMQSMASSFQSQINGSINPVVQGMGTNVMAVKTGSIDPAFAGIRSGLTTVVSAFANGARDVGTHMDTMKRRTQDPVRFTMNTVFSDGLVEMWNGVSDMIGTDKISKRYASFASGGTIPGWSPGVDNHRFYSPTGGRIDLSGGESVMVPEWTKAVGGASGVHAMNAIAKREGARGLSRYFEHASLGGFSGGGIVGSMNAFVKKHFPMMTLTSGLRFTDNGYHSRGMAADFSNGGNAGTPEMTALAQVIHRNFMRQSLEMIHWPLRGFQNINNMAPFNYSHGTNMEHRNHVHWAIPAPLQAAGVDLSGLGGWGPVDWGAMVDGMIKPDMDRIKGDIAGQSFPGKVGKTPQAMYDSMVKPMRETMIEKAEEFMDFSGGGGGAARWSGLALQALQRHGYGAEHLDRMLRQIEIESGGDPTALNLWDSNAMRGTPSGGLLQVIEPTYRRIRNSYPDAFRGLPDDHMFPLTNLVAGVGAVRQDWGGPASRWPTTGGYHMGGLMGAGKGMFHKTAIDPEMVLSPEQTEAFIDWMKGDFSAAKSPSVATVKTAASSFAGEILQLLGVSGNAHAARVSDARGGDGGHRTINVVQHVYDNSPKRAADDIKNFLDRW